jgi:glycerophosphoryl diester phosphodiesterase
MEHRKPLLIAHRGESFDAPENTHAAFDLAWQRGCDAIELDVHVTGDGHVVVCHDRNLQRTAGQPYEIGQSLLATLQGVDVGSWKSPTFAGERVPTLASVLERVPDGRQVFVEIKPGVLAAGPVCEVLAGFPHVNVTVIAFDAEVVREMKRRGDRPVMWLVSPKRDEHTGVWSPSPMQMVNTAMQIADGLDIDARSPIDAAFVEEARSAGLAFYVWTVDDPAHARQLLALGVDGVTTNRAAWMAKQL